MFESSTITIIVALVLVWSLQIFFSNGQIRRFHRRSQELRRQGTHMAVGIAGNMYRRKTYAVVVVDEASKVVAAEQLSGFTVLARLKPISALVGLDLWEIGRGDPPAGVNTKTWAAVAHAAGFLRKAVDPIRAAAFERDAEEVG